MINIDEIKIKGGKNKCVVAQWQLIANIRLIFTGQSNALWEINRLWDYLK